MYHIVEENLELVLVRIFRPRVWSRRIPRTSSLLFCIRTNPRAQDQGPTLKENPRNSNSSLHGLPSTPKQAMNLLLMADIDLLYWVSRRAFVMYMRKLLITVIGSGRAIPSMRSECAAIASSARSASWSTSVNSRTHSSVRTGLRTRTDAAAEQERYEHS